MNQNFVSLTPTIEPKQISSSILILFALNTILLRQYLDLGERNSLQTVTPINTKLKTDCRLLIISGIQEDEMNQRILVKNFKWEGFFSYADVNSEVFGSVYFGNGLCDSDTFFSI